MGEFFGWIWWLSYEVVIIIEPPDRFDGCGYWAFWIKINKTDKCVYLGKNLTNQNCCVNNYRYWKFIRCVVMEMTQHTHYYCIFILIECWPLDQKVEESRQSACEARRRSTTLSAAHKRAKAATDQYQHWTCYLDQLQQYGKGESSSNCRQGSAANAALQVGTV